MIYLNHHAKGWAMERLSDFTRAERLREFGCVLRSIGVAGDDGSTEATLAAARSLYGHDNDIARLVKAAVAPTFSSASDFDDYGQLATTFWASIADDFFGTQIGAKRVNFAEQGMGLITAASASFVASGASKPITRTAYGGIALPVRKVVASLVVQRDSLVTAARGDVESSLVDELRSAVLRRLNATFASASAAVGDAAPAGIAEDATDVTSTGATATAITTDIANMIKALDDNGVSAANASFMGSPRAVATLRLLHVADDAGTLAGLPLLTAAGATGLTLVDGDHVVIAMDERVQVRRSENANVELSDDPDADSGELLSLFQKNMVCLIAEVAINFATFGTDSNGDVGVVSLTGATWV